MRNGLILCNALCLLFMLSSCTAKSELPDMSDMGEVNVISREEGSGTRDVFESVIGTDADGTDNIAVSTEEVSELIGSDRDSIGYAAYSTISLPDTVKVISVNGKEVNEKNISSGKYPLCRNYYIAYSGELSPVESDFIMYVMSAGQKIADDECVAVKKSSSFLSDRSSGKITICGSTSMASLMKKLADDYLNYNPNAEIEVNESNSSDGLNKAIRGECDLAMSSRELADYENELHSTKVVARDAIAVIVNRENPIGDLSDKQIKQIYDNNVEKWSDLNE